MKLERRAVIEWRELFRDMSSDMEMFVAETRQSPSAAVYNDDVAGNLVRQNRRVVNAFSDQVLDFVEDNPDEVDSEGLAAALGITIAVLIDRLRNASANAKRQFIQNNVRVDTPLISRTNQTDMDTAVASAIALNQTASNQEIARASSKDFKNRAFNRANTISATVTQKAAEGAKQIERDTLANVQTQMDVRVAGVDPIKTDEFWISMGDNIVRGSHIAADGQKKEGGVFTVQGQSLRFPGDTSLGATANNVIGCRCSALTSIP
jgi:hypothetical protein